MDARLDKMWVLLDKMVAGLDKMCVRLDAVETRLDKLEAGQNDINVRLDKLELNLVLKIGVIAATSVVAVSAFFRFFLP